MLAGAEGGILQAMQQPQAPAASPTSPSFAGLLAALAAPQRASRDSGDGASPGWLAAPSWSEDGLEDDIATLSYEHALRAHARYRPATDGDRSLTQAALPQPFPVEEPPMAAPAAAKPQPVPVAKRSEAPGRSPRPAFQRNLKCASVTIRMSEEECAQLHRRAAEAGLSVSAYLRSCTFEAESLRALVKDTMAQLRTATEKGQAADPATRRISWFAWLARWLSPGQGGQRAARA